jgi:hypothetical protein
MYKHNPVVLFKHISTWLGSSNYSELISDYVDDIYNHRVFVHVEYEGVEEALVISDTLKFCRNKIIHVYVNNPLLETRRVTKFHFGFYNDKGVLKVILHDIVDFIQLGYIEQSFRKYHD